ncbi:HTH_Tnp_Tc3_2 domain-containing protein [Trichonephila clavipes]|nr:HTH_Tnp_Tc3_2 domain-containing protein [Trichonephila clavipes]
MLCDARELADEIVIPANFELTQPRHTVRRRNVNFDYEARDDPIEDPTLKYKTDTGRPRVTTPNDDRYIYLAVTAKRNRRSIASDLSRQLSSATGRTVSRQTVYRHLGQIGLYARRVSLQSDSRRTLIWRKPGTRYHQENTIERHRYGGVGWLVWEELFWFQN